MTTKDFLLNDEQIRQFIVNGYTSVMTDLPKQLHETIFEKTNNIFYNATEMKFDGRANPLNNILPMVPELYEVLFAPQVRGALTSILGNDYVLHTHRHCHTNFPAEPLENGQGLTMGLHKDGHAGGKRPRHYTPRWAILFYFPRDCPIEQGPTCVIPGNQYLRRFDTADTQTRHLVPDRGDNGTHLLPESFLNRRLVPAVGKVGTVWFFHFDMVHSVFMNITRHARYGMKFVFMRTEEPTQPSWNNKAPMWQPPKLNQVPNDQEILWTGIWNWMCGKADRFESDHIVEGSVETWMRELKSEDAMTRLKAANELGFTRHAASSVVPGLIDALKDAHEPVRRNAAFALAAIGEPAVDPLINALDDGKDAYEAEPILHMSDAARALATIGKPAVAALKQALTDDREHIRAQAAYALGEMGECATDSVSALKDMLTDESTSVRRHAISALGMIKQPVAETVPALVGVLGNWDEPDVGFFAAQALTRIGPEAQAAIPALISALTHGSAYVRGFACEALSRIGTPEALQALVSFLRTARWFNSSGRKRPLFSVNLTEQPIDLENPDESLSRLIRQWATDQGISAPKVQRVEKNRDGEFVITFDHGGKAFAQTTAETLDFYYRS